MADNESSESVVVNGGVNGDSSPSTEFFDDTDFPPLKSPTTPFADVDNLHKRIASLERDNEDAESRIRVLHSDLSRLRSEKDAVLGRHESDHKTAEAISKRAAELETEVARLQHELHAAVTDAAESKEEIHTLNTKISELKREKEVVEHKVREMQSKMEELVKKSHESEGLITGLMDKVAEREAEAVAAAVEREVKGDGDADAAADGWKGLVMGNLPVIGAVSLGVVVVGGVMCYVRHTRN